MSSNLNTCYIRHFAEKRCWIQVYLSQPNPIRAERTFSSVKTPIIRITFNKVRLILNLTPNVEGFCDCAENRAEGLSTKYGSQHGP